MIMVALIFSSIVLGINSCGDLNQLKRLGIRVVPYFFLTTTLAVFLGIGIASAIKPGSYVAKTMVDSFPVENSSPDEINPDKGAQSRDEGHLELPRKLVEFIPANPLRSALEGSMLQIVIFSILVGIALISITRSRSKPLLDFAMSTQEVAMKVVSWAMLIAPFAVFGLLTEITTKMGFDAILGMGTYVATVILGCFLGSSIRCRSIHSIPHTSLFDSSRCLHRCPKHTWSRHSYSSNNPRRHWRSGFRNCSTDRS